MSHFDDTLSPAEAARALRVSERTLARYRDEGLLPYLKISKRKILYLRKDIEKFMSDSYVPAQPYCL